MVKTTTSKKKAMTQEDRDQLRQSKGSSKMAKCAKSKTIKKCKKAASLAVSQGSTLAASNEQSYQQLSQPQTSQERPSSIKLIPFGEQSATLQSQQNTKVLLSLLTKHPASFLLNEPIIQNPATTLTLDELYNLSTQPKIGIESKLELFSLRPLMERMIFKAGASLS